MYKFYIKVINDKETEYVMTSDYISTVSVLMKELSSKLNSTKESVYYTVQNIKSDITLKYKSDKKKVLIGYLNTKDVVEEIVNVEENYFQYYSEQYNIFEFVIECKKYLGNPEKVKLQVKREQIAMGDVVGLEQEFIVKPYVELSSVVNIGSYPEEYTKTIIYYTDLDGNKTSEIIRTEGVLTTSDMALSNFLQLYRIDTKQAIIMEQLKR